MVKSKFVVTGCSRSATSYMSDLLSTLGLKCGHERVFNIFRVYPLHGSVSNTEWFGDKDGDSSFLAVPFLKELPADSVVLHQVRNPVNVIRSHMGIRFFAQDYRPSIYLADNHPDFLNFLRLHCPEIFIDEDELQRTIRFWICWNRMIQVAVEAANVQYFRYRIEALDSSLLRDIVGVLQVEVDQRAMERALATISRSTNTRVRADAISWQALPENQLKTDLMLMAGEYGYSSNDCLGETEELVAPDVTRCDI